MIGVPENSSTRVPARSCGVCHDGHELEVDHLLPLVVTRAQHEDMVQLRPVDHRGGCDIGDGARGVCRNSKGGGFGTLNEGNVADWVTQKNNLALLRNRRVRRVTDRFPGFVGHWVVYIEDRC